MLLPAQALAGAVAAGIEMPTGHSAQFQTDTCERQKNP
jgi:hypothetical protein